MVAAGPLVGFDLATLDGSAWRARRVTCVGA